MNFSFQKKAKKSPPKPRFKPDLSCFHFEVDDMWNILGINQERVNVMVAAIEKIIKDNGNQITYKKLLEKSLRTIPKNQSEVNWMIFHMGCRWQLAMSQNPLVFSPTPLLENQVAQDNTFTVKTKPKKAD